MVFRCFCQLFTRGKFHHICVHTYLLALGYECSKNSYLMSRSFRRISDMTFRINALFLMLVPQVIQCFCFSFHVTSISLDLRQVLIALDRLGMLTRESIEFPQCLQYGYFRLPQCLQRVWFRSPKRLQLGTRRPWNTGSGVDVGPQVVILCSSRLLCPEGQPNGSRGWKKLSQNSILGSRSLSDCTKMIRNRARKESCRKSEQTTSKCFYFLPL